MNKAQFSVKRLAPKYLIVSARNNGPAWALIKRYQRGRWAQIKWNSAHISDTGLGIRLPGSLYLILSGVYLYRLFLLSIKTYI